MEREREREIESERETERVTNQNTTQCKYIVQTPRDATNRSHNAL